MAVLTIATVALVPSTGRAQASGVSGLFSLMQMVHTTGTPSGTGVPVPANAWDGRSPGASFRYSGIPCTGNAPVNNIATDLTTYNTRLPGSRSPASTRFHPLEFSATQLERPGMFQLSGSIVLTVCQLRGGATANPDPVPDPEKDKITFTWTALADRTSPEEVRYEGTFRITGGTGVYKDLTGEGRIAGYFFCFAAPGCANLGELRDGQLVMHGSYQDPTVPDGVSGTAPPSPPATRVATDPFTMIQMVHTTGTPSGTGVPIPGIPWNGTTPGGPFRYAGIPCTGNAPVNNIATDLTTYNTRVPGSRSPASTRMHPLQFTATAQEGGTFRLDGTITLTVCRLRGGPNPSPDIPEDPEKEKIFLSWTAVAQRTSVEEVRWAGTFTINGGTGRYRNLSGTGEIAGYFFCFDPAGCGPAGPYRDGQLVLQGAYAAPNVPGNGYWMAAADGGVFTFGHRVFHGSTGAIRLNRPIVAMAATPSRDGYWLAASDGGIFAFGDATFRGSTGGIRLNRPIVDIAATPSGGGYWLAASDGGVFAFGDAVFHGSTGGIRLNRPVVDIVPTRSGGGYWLVASDGGVFAFGDAVFHGSTGGVQLNQPIVGASGTPTGHGYWMVASDGGIFAFGDASFLGSTGNLRLSRPVVDMEATPSGNGYWLVASDGGVFAFGDAPFLGSTGGIRLSQPVVALAQ